AGPGQPDATSANYVALSVTIAAPEVGHTAGLLHTDSLAPINFGTHNPPGVSQYLPIYPGPQAAWETAHSIIASPASVGSTLFDALSTHFSAREDIKLAFIEGGTVVNDAAGHSLATAQALSLVGLSVPNTTQTGFYEGKVLSVAATDVIDAAIQIGASNYYSFQGRAGDVINIQTLSFELTRISDPVDTMLSVYDSSGNLVPYYTGQATNDDGSESGDAAIVDLRLPATGTYYIKVEPFNNTQTGHYELFIYRFQAGNAIPNGGSHDSFVVGPGQSTFVGRG